MSDECVAIEPSHSNTQSMTLAMQSVGKPIKKVEVQNKMQSLVSMIHRLQYSAALRHRNGRGTYCTCMYKIINVILILREQDKLIIKNCLQLQNDEIALIEAFHRISVSIGCDSKEVRVPEFDK